MASDHAHVEVGGLWGFIRRLGASALAGLILIAAATIAFAWANSAWSASYEAILGAPVSVGVGSFVLNKPLVLWINDGLMAVFFLLVGLEVKRELIEGALSTARAAALPIFAAVGGVVVPAGIYLVVTITGGASTDGWAVPAATDIAFALGILALLGKRVPIELKVFLTAVAVVDDIVAVLIIAAFFTETVAVGPLVAAVGLALLLFLLNRAGVRRSVPYVVLGALLWLAVLKTGIHATVAGVVLAAFIPLRRQVAVEDFRAQLDKTVLDQNEESRDLPPETMLHHLRELVSATEPLLLRWEHALSPYVLFMIMPIFAIANAGVTLDGSGGGLGAVGWGVAAGLLLGKPIGITAGAWLGVRLGLCDLGDALSFRLVHAVSWLGGIGFTMSLFITGLSLSGADATGAKVGLLSASIVAALVGAFAVVRATSTPGSTSPAESA